MPQPRAALFSRSWLPPGSGGGGTHLSSDHVLPKVPDQVPPHHQRQLLLGQQRQRRAQQAEAQVAEGRVAQPGQSPGRAGWGLGPEPAPPARREGGQGTSAPRTWQARTASSVAPAPQLPSRTGRTCPREATGGAGPEPRRAVCAPSSRRRPPPSGHSPVWGGGRRGLRGRRPRRQGPRGSPSSHFPHTWGCSHPRTG